MLIVVRIGTRCHNSMHEATLPDARSTLLLHHPGRLAVPERAGAEAPRGAAYHLKGCRNTAIMGESE